MKKLSKMCSFLKIGGTLKMGVKKIRGTLIFWEALVARPGLEHVINEREGFGDPPRT